MAFNSDNSIISELNKVKISAELPLIKIYDLPIKKKFKITFGKLLKTKYGNSVLIGLDNEVSTFLPKRYSEIIKPKTLPELIGKIMIIESIKTVCEDKQSVYLTFLDEEKEEEKTHEKI